MRSIGRGAGLRLFPFFAGAMLLAATPALAGENPTISAGDTAWVLCSSALVLLMTAPGLALFYGGMVRRKNVLATLMHSFILTALISLQWAICGYSLAFSPHNALIGGLSWLGLSGVSATQAPSAYAPTVPHQAYMVFQCMFAIITPALITGAFAERISFRGFLLFSLLWTTFIYDPLAHWVWGVDGWIHHLGALDFAGGTVVHISSGVSALAAVLVIGRRRGYPREPMIPHNLTMTVMGAGLLWFGWFGFNAGSALAANGLAVSAFVNTNTAAAMAALTWMTISWAHKGVPSVVGATAGAVAGLVAITPAAGYVTPAASILIGRVVSLVCYGACQLRDRINVDDALDVWAVHGVGGTVGAICTGLFATVTINAGAANGLFYGNPGQLGVQLIAVCASWIFSGVMTFAILKLVNVFVPLRVSEKEEAMGLDLSQHSEIAYSPS